jgi:hypothetical protein
MSGSWPLELDLLPGRSAEEVRLALRELIRGLTVAAADGWLLPLSPEVDAVWLAVLAAPDGHDFLAAALPAGAEFVDVRTGSVDMTAAVHEWFAGYVSRFGPMSREVVRYWPAAQWLQRLGVDPCAVRS